MALADQERALVAANEMKIAQARHGTGVAANPKITRPNHGTTRKIKRIF
jgi:hypothetical protein